MVGWMAVWFIDARPCAVGIASPPWPSAPAHLSQDRQSHSTAPNILLYRIWRLAQVAVPTLSGPSPSYTYSASCYLSPSSPTPLPSSSSFTQTLSLTLV